MWHPDESALLAFADRELPAAEQERIRDHVAECAECQALLERHSAVYGGYRDARRAMLPPPPRPWADLSPAMRRYDAERERRERRWAAFRLSFPSLRWVAAAAAATVAVVVFQMGGPRQLNAAELLSRAVAAESRSSVQKVSAKPKRVRIRAIKPGRETALPGLLRKARFSWEEPLSVRAFANWRDGLPQREDRVDVLNESGRNQSGRNQSGRFYRIATSTSGNALSEATITLRADDMQPVSQTFRFSADEGGDLIEVVAGGPDSGTEVQEAAVPARPNPAEPQSVPARLTPAQELRVVAAVHAAGADLGDPVEIDRDDERGRMVVRALAADEARQAQLRAALAGIPWVDLKIEQPEAVRRPERTSTLSAESANETKPFQDRLAAQLGSRDSAENLTNHVMDLSEAALARAYALRALARRFPADAEAGFAPADLAVLRRIQEDHIRALVRTTRELTDLLRSVARQPGNPASDAGAGDWREATEELLKAARALDSAVSTTLAGTGAAEDPSAAFARLAGAAGRLQARAASLETVLARGPR